MHVFSSPHQRKILPPTLEAPYHPHETYHPHQRYPFCLQFCNPTRNSGAGSAQITLNFRFWGYNVNHVQSIAVSYRLSDLQWRVLLGLKKAHPILFAKVSDHRAIAFTIDGGRRFRPQVR